jgi:predicted metalloprotease with PDZ domain
MRERRFVALLVALVSCFLPAFLRGAPEPVHHALSFADAARQHVHVESLFPAEGAAELELAMAVWTPGSYLVREFARHVEGLSAASADGAPLPVEKVRKNRWLVATRGAGEVIVRYRLYAGEMSVQGNWVDSDFASLNGAPTFLTPARDLEERRARPHLVRLDLPAGWSRSLSGMPLHEGRENHYAASSFDVLVDSPILAGSPAVYEFEVGGKKHVLAHQGEGGVWDGARSAADVRKIVETTHRFWGDVPYDRYVFLNVIAEGRGGLEHLNSTLMMTSRWAARVPKEYRRWLGLVSHELFHTWNVKRLRPAGLGPFDYEKEVPTKSLWIAEGLTSYYDDLLLARAGLLTEKQYLAALSKQIETLQTTPGREIHPLEMTSWDAWIKFYRPDENSANSTISYYTKGAVVGFLLDAEIRAASESTRSLDDVMRRAYALYSGERGYTPEEFRAVVSEVAAKDLSTWLHHAVATTEELRFDAALAFYGLRFKDPDARGKGASEDAEDDGAKDGGDGEDAEESEDPPRKKAWLGIVTRNDGGRLHLAEVRRDGPGWAHGLNAGDEVLAIDGYRLRADGWEKRLEQYQPGDQVTVLVARRDRLLSIPVVFGEEPPKRWRLEARPEATESEKKRRAIWLLGVTER